MDRQFLRTPQFTKANIMENVLAPNNYDGIKAHQDL